MAYLEDKSSPVPLVEVKNLAVTFESGRGTAHAVRDVSLKINQADRIAMIGESGSGKTITTLTLLGLLPERATVAGEVFINEKNYDPLNEEQVRKLVRNEISAIFQDSLSGLNPIQKVGEQLSEVRTLKGDSKKIAKNKVIEAMQNVGINDANMRYKLYPHQMSGGMRQRVMIAMALLASPRMLIADEPTTALDTLVQTQVVDLILKIQKETSTALLLITHDIALAADVCSEAVVMYAGFVMEKAPMQQILKAPAHPYTLALLESMPKLDQPRNQLLQAISGETPSAYADIKGCPFAPRCRFARDICKEEVPELRPLTNGAQVRCVRAEEIASELERRA